MQGIAIASSAPASAGTSAAAGGSVGGVAEDSASGGTNLFGAILAGQLKGRTIAVKLGADDQSGVVDIGKALSGKEKDLERSGISIASEALADMLALAGSGLLPIVVQQSVQAGGVVTSEGQAILSEIVLGGGIDTDALKPGVVAKKGDLDSRSGTETRSTAEVAEGRDTGGRLAEIAGDGKTQQVPVVVEELKAPVEVKVVDFSESLERASIRAGAASDAGLQNPVLQSAMVQMTQVGGAGQQVAMESRAYTVAPAVGSKEWGGALGDKVAWIASQGSQVAELQLNPPNLGPLEVRVTVGADQQANVVFVSQQPAVREAIETAMPRLREMLADSGIMLGNSMVGAESFQQQQQAHSQKSGGGKGGSPEADPLDGVMAGIGVSGGGAQVRSGQGMVDMFV